MHYTFPQCRRSFTPGQVQRMECTLKQWRPKMVAANAVEVLQQPDQELWDHIGPNLVEEPFVFQ